MQDFVQGYLYFCILCSVIGIALAISKWAAFRGGKILYGSVTNIQSTLTGFNLTIKIKDNYKTIYKKKFVKRDVMHYSIGDTIEYYEIAGKQISKSKYYAFPLIIGVTPWILLFIVLFNSDSAFWIGGF